MARIAEIIEKHRAYGRALYEAQMIREQNAAIKHEDNDLFVKKSFVLDEIRDKRSEQAKKLWAEMDQERFTYEFDTATVDVYNPYGPDRERTVFRSTVCLSVMGLKVPVGRMETDARGQLVTVEDLLVEGKFDPKTYMGGLLDRMEIDPEGTKKAICESVRVRMMKNRAALPVEIAEVKKEIEEAKLKISKLEKLVEEEVPDNAIMRKIFKKKFEAKAKAPKEIEDLKNQIQVLEAKKDNLEYRLETAEKLSSAEAIEQYVEEEYAYLQQFIARDWGKEVDDAVVDLEKQAQAIEDQRKELRKGEKSTWQADNKVSELKRAFEDDFDSIRELFDDKDFLKELREFETADLTEEEKKIVEIIRDQYDKYLAKTISRYEQD